MWKHAEQDGKLAEDKLRRWRVRCERERTSALLRRLRKEEHIIGWFFRAVP